MTRKRNDSHSTEFGLWLREQPELDSVSKHFTATNLDYIWQNYRTGEWMLIEEKRYMSPVGYSQRKLFKLLHKAVRDPKYRGIHLIQFEKTSPEDGEIILDGKHITKRQLLNFLQFR